MGKIKHILREPNMEKKFVNVESLSLMTPWKIIAFMLAILLIIANVTTKMLLIGKMLAS